MSCCGENSWSCCEHYWDNPKYLDGYSDSSYPSSSSFSDCSYPLSSNVSVASSVSSDSDAEYIVDPLDVLYEKEQRANERGQWINKRTKKRAQKLKRKEKKQMVVVKVYVQIVVTKV